MCKKCDNDLHHLLKLSGLAEANGSDFDPFADFQDDDFMSDVSTSKGEFTGVKKDPTELMQKYTEPCRDCGGSGVFRSYNGNVVGPCYKCKGKGSKSYATSPEQREKSRASAAKRKVNKVEAFKEEHPDVFAWLEANKARNDFANSLHQQVLSKGALSDRQMAAIQSKLPPKPVPGQASPLDKFKEQYPREFSWIEGKKDNNDFARSLYDQLTIRGGLSDKQLAAIQRQLPRENMKVTGTKVEDAFKIARSKGIKTPKMYLEKFRLSYAGENSRNPGAIYASEKETGTFLGMIKDGHFIPRSECTEEMAAEIIRVMNDPYGAAKAFGQKTGFCSFCGQELTQKLSVSTSIGPICAGKYGIDRESLLQNESISESYDFMLIHRLNVIAKVLKG